MKKLTGLYGIPVIIESYTPEVKPKIWALPEDCYPGEHAEIEWSIDGDDADLVNAILELMDQFIDFDEFDEDLIQQIEEEKNEEY